MKTLILFLFALIIPVAVISQNPSGKSSSSGKVTYEDRVKREMKFEGDEAQFSESFPKERVSNKILLFNSDFSLYQKDESKKSDVVMQKSHSGVTKIVLVGQDKTFTDLKNKKMVEQKEFMTRKFLIESDLGNSTWKLTGNTSTVLGYYCQEAVKEDKVGKIRALFTTSIPVSTGPDVYSDLPGLVLLVDINDGKQLITATSIDLAFNDFSTLTRPKEGKKVTSEEYKEIVDSKLKEMGSDGAESGANVMMRINN